MNLIKSHIILAEKIIAIFEKGISISPNTLFFAESTYGFTSFREFTAALLDDGFDDREVLLGLVFSPDLSVRLQLESMIGKMQFSNQDVDAISKYVCRKIENIRLIFSDQIESYHGTDLTAVLMQYVKKMNLSKALDPEVCSILETHLPDDVAVRSRVFMRCSSHILNEKANRVLSHFIEKAAKIPDAFVSAFEMFINFLSQVPEDMLIPDFLFAKRQAYETMLAQIQDFNKGRNRYGLEYLLMNRFPVPHESEETIQHKLQILDTILFDILHYQPRMLPVKAELGAFDLERDIGRLLKTMD